MKEKALRVKLMGAALALAAGAFLTVLAAPASFAADTIESYDNLLNCLADNEAVVVADAGRIQPMPPLLLNPKEPRRPPSATATARWARIAIRVAKTRETGCSPALPRLAVELDGAIARSKSVELTNENVVHRLNRASAEIRAVLAEAAAHKG